MQTGPALVASPTPAVADRSWRGHWIGSRPASAGDVLGLGRDAEPAPFHRVLFRRTFAVDAVPDTVPARLTADSRYVLYVNGVEVGRGPQRSQPRRLCYDSHDLASCLRPGANVVAVLVTYYGNATAFWQPAVPNGSLGADATLVFEARVNGSWLVSDDDWRVHSSTAWTMPERAGVDGVPVEVRDARRLPHDWARADFDDTGWEHATVLGAAHIGGFGRTRPPTDPYGALLPRSIGELTGETVEADRVRRSYLPAAAEPVDHPIMAVRQVVDGHDRDPAEQTGFPVDLDPPQGQVSHLVVDFGRIVAGLVQFELEAPAGTRVDLLYCERPYVSGDDNPLSAPRIGAGYVARGHHDVFEALETNGLRYAHLVVSAADGAARLLRFAVRELLYPQIPGAYFRCDDAELNALYTAGVRTVQLNAHDAFTDCPTREQRAWVGDGVVHQLVQLTTNNDWRLARNYLWLGNSPRPDGILPMTVVGDIEAGGGFTIPDWSLHWVHGVYNLYRYLGDRSELLSLLPTVERILRWYLPYVDDRGTIADVPEWNLVDWASVFSTGRSALLTALWARALAEFAEIGDYVGNAGSAGWARGLLARAAEGFEDFWDETRGTYVDHVVDGEPQPAASQAAGATAIVSGLAPQERWSRIIDTITDPDTLVVRSWIGGNDGGYDPQKIADQIRGVQQVDWDAEREVVIAQPFFSYLVHEAVAQAGRAADLVTLVRRWSQFLVGGYDTFGECWGWGTPVHGWSSAPARDLVAYVLGITPAEPGFAAARVAPAPGSLRHLEGAVPTPHGLVTVQVDADRVRIVSPVPVVFVGSDGAEVRLPAGTQEIAR
ncbi:hypothetical protein GCM10009841_05140 [Microlunatus panaciterrae]|uniref:Alpha-L-rhamnosidase n=1 Tax=Microlunatus panaciterrae TaxID=400768 RepID=A0ABS2RLN3_9ACTN|nr:family 78 glycoside hydrolase catalytic domain [Microlunatus panaciterrae]MBM7798829.1 hypothetical protein [Microlunatus panaciterrae]